MSRERLKRISEIIKIVTVAVNKTATNNDTNSKETILTLKYTKLSLQIEINGISLSLKNLSLNNISNVEFMLLKSILFIVIFHPKKKKSINQLYRTTHL